ncbi:MAG: hypothetical protein ACRENL_05270 [Candidatus Dormibacteria bacterium]
MTGWRRGATVHTFAECVSGDLEPVQLVHLSGEWRLLDDLTKLPVVVHVCGNCARRGRL